MEPNIIAGLNYSIAVVYAFTFLSYAPIAWASWRRRDTMFLSLVSALMVLSFSLVLRAIYWVEINVSWMYSEPVGNSWDLAVLGYSSGLLLTGLILQYVAAVHDDSRKWLWKMAAALGAVVFAFQAYWRS